MGEKLSLNSEPQPSIHLRVLQSCVLDMQARSPNIKASHEESSFYTPQPSSTRRSPLLQAMSEHSFYQRDLSRSFSGRDHYSPGQKLRCTTVDRRRVLATRTQGSNLSLTGDQSRRLLRTSSTQCFWTCAQSRKMRNQPLSPARRDNGHVKSQAKCRMSTAAGRFSRQPQFGNAKDRSLTWIGRVASHRFGTLGSSVSHRVHSSTLKRTLDDIFSTAPPPPP